MAPATGVQPCDSRVEVKEEEEDDSEALGWKCTKVDLGT